MRRAVRSYFRRHGQKGVVYISSTQLPVAIAEFAGSRMGTRCKRIELASAVLEDMRNKGRIEYDAIQGTVTFRCRGTSQVIEPSGSSSSRRVATAVAA